MPLINHISRSAPYGTAPYGIAAASQVTPTPPSLLEGGGEVDLLGIGTSPTNASTTIASTSLALCMNITMSADAYQSMCSQIAHADAVVSTATIEAI